MREQGPNLKDQLALTRYAMLGGMKSSPVFARAFGITYREAETLMEEAGRPRCPCGFEETRVCCADCDEVLAGRERT